MSNHLEIPSAALIPFRWQRSALSAASTKEMSFVENTISSYTARTYKKNTPFAEKGKKTIPSMVNTVTGWSWRKGKGNVEMILVRIKMTTKVYFSVKIQKHARLRNTGARILSLYCLLESNNKRPGMAKLNVDDCSTSGAKWEAKRKRMGGGVWVENERRNRRKRGKVANWDDRVRSWC